MPGDRRHLGETISHYWRQRDTEDLERTHRRIVGEVAEYRLALAAGTPDAQASLDDAIWCLGLLEDILAARRR